MGLTTLVLLAWVAVGSLAVPVREHRCARECQNKDGEGIFKSDPGRVYTFQYGVTIYSYVDDGGYFSDRSEVNVMATASITTWEACEMTLSLSDISVTEKAANGAMVVPATVSDFRDSLEAYPLRFAMENNGTITSVCPEEGEEVWVLNIKRGFLSAMQTKRVSSDAVLGQAGIFETDVTGTCIPTYQTDGSTLVKTQDYLMCKNRTNLNMFVDAIPVHLLAPTTGPLDSSRVCRYQMDVEGVTSVACEEEHILKPLVEDMVRPSTMVRTTITRKGTPSLHRLPFSSLYRISRQTSLLYEQPDYQSDVDSDDVLTTLNDICGSVSEGVGSETPDLFQTLTKQLEQLDTDNINVVIARLPLVCPCAEKEVTNMVKDALIDCDSEECAQAFSSIIQTQNLADNASYLKTWFMKLVFHKNPTKSIINQVHRYIRGSSNVNLPAYYALSSMVHRYCLLAGFEKCSRDSDILVASAVFENNLNETCLPENDEMVKKMLMSLRAIGNMGLIQSKSLLNKCINRDSNPNKIRIAAIEAFRRAPCNQVPTNRFMDIFSTSANDAELRIAAFRALIRCPSDVIMEGIAETMTREPTHQVTCYASSYLGNLRDSQNPLLHDLQDTIRGSVLANSTVCSSDAIIQQSRKFSYSSYGNVSGDGLHVDGDVVFSDTSYLPQSLKLGVSVDLFGYGVDLFELDARTEGLQGLVESFIDDVGDDRASIFMDIIKRLIHTRVNRRSEEGVTSPAVGGIQAEFTETSNEQDQTTDASFAMKILNNEVFYKDNADFRQFAENFSPKTFMKIMAMLTRKRTLEYTFNKNFKPSRVTIPTIVGMPLEVNIEGAITTLLKASGKLDVVGMAAARKTMAIFGTLDPSAAIEVRSHMMVDAHCSRSGLAHKAKMATSLTLGGSVTYEHGMFKVKVDAPRRRQTFIDASSKLFYMRPSGLVSVPELRGDSATADDTWSHPYYRPRYILSVRGRLPINPFSRSALTRQWSYEAYLDKQRDELMTYDLELGFRTDKFVLNGTLQKVDKFHFLIGTPGSESIGTFQTDATFHHSNRTLLCRMWTSRQDTYFAASYEAEPDRKRFFVNITDALREWRWEMGLDTLFSSKGVIGYPIYKYTSLFRGRIQRVHHLEGHVSRNETRTVFDMALLNQDGDVRDTFKGFLRDEPDDTYLFVHATNEHRQSRLEVALDTRGDVISPLFNYTVEVPDFFFSLDLFFTSIFKGNFSKDGSWFLWNLGFRRHDEKAPGTRGTVYNQPDRKLLLLELADPSHEINLEVGFDTLLAPDGDILIPVFNYTTVWPEDAIDGYFLEGNYSRLGAQVEWDISLNVRDGRLAGFLASSQGSLLYEEHVKNLIVELDLRDSYKQRLEMGYTTLWFGHLIVPLFNYTVQYPYFVISSRDVPFHVIVTGNLTRDEIGIEWDIGHIYIDRLKIFGIRGDVVQNYWRRILTWNLETEWRVWYPSRDRFQVTGIMNDSAVILDAELTRQDGTDTPTIYYLILDLKNTTVQGQIFSWIGMVEMDVPAYPKRGFRFDTTFDLSPGHSSGNLIRLCYEGIDCKASEKRILLAHNLTFQHDGEHGLHDHDLQATYKHQVNDEHYTFSMITHYDRGVICSTRIAIDDERNPDMLDASATNTPEYVIKMVIRNHSTADALKCNSSLAFIGPDHRCALSHSVYVATDERAIRSVLTGNWNEEEFEVDLDVQEDRGITHTDLAVTTPNHVYEISNSNNDIFTQCNTSIIQDSQPILVQNVSLVIEQSDEGGNAITFHGQQELMGGTYNGALSLSNTDDSISCYLDLQANDNEIIYFDATANSASSPDRENFGVAVETRSDYLPGYDTKVDVEYERTSRHLALNSTLSVDGSANEIAFSIDNEIDSSGYTSSRNTRVMVAMPSNPDPRLQHVTLEDSCRRERAGDQCSTSLAWGNELSSVHPGDDYIQN